MFNLLFYRYGAGEVQANDQCAVYKVGFTQDLYFQYIQYKTDIPDLKQFTLCYWSKFYNHTNDHPIFSYAGESNNIKNILKTSFVRKQSSYIFYSP